MSHGSEPDPAALLAAASKLLGGKAVDLVTVDMPVATTAVERRRAADNRLSAVYGGRGCAVHSPTKERPGEIGYRVSSGFAAAGYRLATADTPVGSRGCLVEVYPHPALLALLNEKRRYLYKVEKLSRYRKGSTVRERAAFALGAFSRILDALRRRMDGIALVLPDLAEVSTLSSLKRYEDTIDALVCAWVGVEYLAGRALAFGDGTAAIWVPWEVTSATQPYRACKPLPKRLLL
jgi:predicted RNase H-like nuclease